MVQIVHARRPLARKSSRAGFAALGPDQFEGYASLFGVADGAGDTMAPGAFAASLRRRGPAEVRLLYQHYSHAPTGDQAIQAQIQTVIREVPRHVPAQADADCRVPWGVVRLLDAAASGADTGDVAARVAPGQPDDAASDVKLSEIVAVQAANLGAARQNAGQLEALEKAVNP